jgi:predicted dehydrogenase
MTSPCVNWAIAGLGKIANRFASDLIKDVPNARLYAVAARTEERAIKFKNQYKAQVAHGSYLALAQDNNVDIVYVATIHPFHKELVKLFVSHGKHVLVEKPAFTNLNDWDEMTALAASHNVLLLEAMKAVTFPGYRALKKYIEQHNITVNSIEASFGNWHEFDTNLPIFNGSLSGGATLDVGVYALWLYADLCQLMNAEIPNPRVHFENDNEASNVDENVLFHFDGPLRGQIGASITRDLPRIATIKGDGFAAIMNEKWWSSSRIEVSHNGKEFVIEEPWQGGGFQYEARLATELLASGLKQSKILNGDTSRKVISIMENALRQGGYSHLIGR